MFLLAEGVVEREPVVPGDTHESDVMSCVQDKANEQPLWKKTGVNEAWLYQNKLLACSLSLHPI